MVTRPGGPSIASLLLLWCLLGADQASAALITCGHIGRSIYQCDIGYWCNDGHCTPLVCVCVNGVPSIGVPCPQHQLHHCRVCVQGYSLVSVGSEVHCEPNPNPPGAMPDPHIFTWKGILYNYHGQCDLIYTTCPSFDNNKGLRIHMRTKFVMPDEWSTITNLAVKIGEDTFELQEDGIYHVNGEVNPALSDTANLAGHEMKQATRHNGHDFSIALGNGISLEVANYVRETRNSLAFKITGVHDHRDNGGTSLSDCVGLTSTWDHPEDHRFLVGRSGTMYSAANRVEFGPEWQVDRSKGDPMLFAEDVGQQLPDQRCIDSKDDLGHRRLLDDAEAEALGLQAEDACRHLNDRNADLFEACVSDILLTGDVSFAEEPWYNGGDEF